MRWLKTWTIFWTLIIEFVKIWWRKRKNRTLFQNLCIWSRLEIRIQLLLLRAKTTTNFWVLMRTLKHYIQPMISKRLTFSETKSPAPRRIRRCSWVTWGTCRRMVRLRSLTSLTQKIPLTKALKSTLAWKTTWGSRWLCLQVPPGFWSTLGSLKEPIMLHPTTLIRGPNHRCKWARTLFILTKSLKSKMIMETHLLLFSKMVLQSQKKTSTLLTSKRLSNLTTTQCHSRKTRRSFHLLWKPPDGCRT